MSALFWHNSKNDQNIVCSESRFRSRADGKGAQGRKVEFVQRPPLARNLHPLVSAFKNRWRKVKPEHGGETGRTELESPN